MESQITTHYTEPNRRKILSVSIILLVLIISGLLLWRSKSNTDSKNYSAQSLPVEAYKNAALSSSKVQIPSIISSETENAESLPMELRGLLFKKAHNLIIQSVKYQDGKAGFLITGSTPSDDLQSSFNEIRNLMLGLRWKLLAGARNEQSALLEFDTNRWVSRIVIVKSDADNLKLEIYALAI
jgi:hypothetical protein